jgi:carbohydrate kinase (thermoresistant glucokinase family)
MPKRGDACIAVVMGVSGSGKTTIGAALARRLGWSFADADTFHPPANIAKMSAGQPLDDNDRAPWLAAISGRIDAWRRHNICGVVACSALKRRYRDVLVSDRPEVRLVHLEGGRDLIAARLAGRHGHFMPGVLLDSQFEALEPPGPDEHPVVVPIDRPVAAIVETLVMALSRPAATISPG